MDQTVTVFLFILFLVLGGLGLIATGIKFFDTSAEQRRIQAFILEKQDGLGSRDLIDPQKREFSETLIQRTIVAWLNAIVNFFGRYTPHQTLQETNRRLVIAGNPYNFRAAQYYGVRVLFFLVGMVISITIYQFSPSSNNLIFALSILLVFLLAPSMWLSALMRNRQNLIRKGLPDALDMLSVITAAGLSFDQAMLRLGQTFKTPIGMEFSRVVSEIEVGVSRRQALRNLKERVDISEISSFVSIILQSEMLGMSIADVLHSQAEQMRIYRQFRAKEVAQQLPAKMMVPLALFIFPALFAVILGPFIPVLMEILK